MTKKARYILIAVGVVVFAVCAPLMVLYVQGISYDFATGVFVKTGLLAIRSEPKDASVSLDGKVVLKATGDIKFLLPKEYTVTLHKDGYFDWTKRLLVQTNQVTWANPAPDKIVLFKNHPATKTIGNVVQDFFVSGNTLVTISSSTLAVSTLLHPDQSENYPLPFAADAITASPDGSRFLLSQNPSASTTSTSTLAVLYTASEHHVYNLSSLFSQPAQFYFSDSNQLYALSDSTVFQINWIENSKTTVETNVQSFAVLSKQLYAIIQIGGKQFLTVATLPDLLDKQTLSFNIPPFQNGKIIITYQKQIFLLLDHTLYRVDSTLQKVSDQVNQLQFNPLDGSIIISSAGELDSYDFNSQSLNFITRTAMPLTNPYLAGNIHYAMVIKNSGISAIELDTRDQQNQYTLYSGNAIHKFYVDPAGKQLVVLDGQELKLLQIR